MKKPVKIILSAALFVAIVVSLNYLQDIIFPPNDDDPPTTTHYSYLKKQVEDGWESQGQWNKILYDSLAKEINDYSQRGEIGAKSRNELLNLNNSSAIEEILKYYDSEMKRAECNVGAIKKNYEGVKTVMNFTDDKGRKTFEATGNVTEADNMYRAFDAVMTFVKKNFKRNAEVDDALKWTPYDRSRFDREKNALARSKYYKKWFSNINIVKNAWNSYEDKVAKANKDYYSSLTSILKGRFDKSQQSILDKKGRLSAITSSLERKTDDLKKAVATGIDDQAGILEELEAHKGELARHKEQLESLLREAVALSKKWADVQSRFKTETTAEIQNDHKVFFDSIDKYITVTVGYPMQNEVRNLIDKVTRMENEIRKVQ